jgi:CheY-like chemotaxis protein
VSTLKTVILFVIDDDSDHRELVSRAARNFCKTSRILVKVSAFRDTRGARKKLQHMLPDFILCDMRIPNDLEGPESLYATLRERGESGRICFMTSNISPHDEVVRTHTGATILKKTLLCDDPATFFARLFHNHAST